VCLRGDENLCVKPQSIGVYAQGGYATHMIAPHPRHLFDIGRLSPRERRRWPARRHGLLGVEKVSATLKDEPLVIIGARRWADGRHAGAHRWARAR